MNHNYIGTEHILLGLTRVDDGFACRVLESLGVSLDVVRREVEAVIGIGATPASGHVPFTPRAKKVLDLSLREAQSLGHTYIGTEHILLGLIREGEGVAAQILVRLGLELSDIRRQIVQMPEDPPARTVSVSASLGSGATFENRSPFPLCSECRKPLEGALRFRTLEALDQETSATRQLIVAFCAACGTPVPATIVPENP